MSNLEEQKKELRQKSDEYLIQIVDDLEQVKVEGGVLLKNLLFATGAGLAVWGVGSGLANLIGKKSKKGKFGKMALKIITPVAAKVIVDLLKTPQNQHQEIIEKNEIPEEQD